MPKPVYIVCSESGSEDRSTGLTSHFNVVEQIVLQELPPPPEGKLPVLRPLNLQISAVWASEESDSIEIEFEFQMRIFVPASAEPIYAGGGTFRFEKPRFRSLANVHGIILDRPGVFRAEARIRRANADKGSWLVQSYEILVTLLRPPPMPEAPPG
jgi:hypothetical protein